MPQYCLPKESRLNDFRVVKVPKPSSFFKKVSSIPDDFDFPTVETDDLHRKTDQIAATVSSLEDELSHSFLKESQIPLDFDNDSSSEDVVKPDE